MKKFKIVFIFLFLIFIGNINAYAAQVEDSGAYGTYGEVSVSKGDYELVCTYSDGAELTITKKETYLTNFSNSNGMDSNANNGVSMYLTENQTNKLDDNGNLLYSNADNITEKGRCPSRLFLYKVKSKEDDINVPEEEQLKNVDNYYYSTEDNIQEMIAGLKGLFKTKSKAEKIDDEKIKLVSEEVYLTNSKIATVCDYKTAVSNEEIGGKSISIYMYKNMTFIDNNDRITTLDSVLNNCPAELTEEEIEDENNKKLLYVNDPTPRSVGGAYSGNYQYDSIRFFTTENKIACKSENNNNECSKYKFVGKRYAFTDDLVEEDVCDLLGNETIKILREVVNWIQILVPALVIVLIALDITKMVLAGNLDEELPKKKKSIIIRLIVMLIFFFAPTIVGLIIKLLNESGVNVGDIQCFFK